MSSDKLYLTYEELTASVFESQVIGQLNYLNDRGWEFDLLSLYSPRFLVSRRGRARLRGTASRYREVFKGQMCLRPHVTPARYWRWNLPLLAAFVRRRRVRMIFARGVYAANLAIAAKRRCENLRVIYDCRGAVAAERAEYGVGRLDMPATRCLERHAVLDSDHVLCVSHALRAHLHEEYGRRQGVDVVPCCPDVERLRFLSGARTRLRLALGIESRLVLLFSGSVAPWQCVPQCAEFFKRLHSLNPACFFLVLSKDVQAAEEILRDCQLDGSDSRVICAENRDMQGYLAAADVAMICREPTVTNRVASPVKVGEYLASGLPVLVSPGIGDYSDLLVNERLGVQVRFSPDEDTDLVLTQLATFLAEPRETRSSRAAPHIDRDRYIRAYLDAFGESNPRKEDTRESATATTTVEKKVGRCHVSQWSV